MSRSHGKGNEESLGVFEWQKAITRQSDLPSTTRLVLLILSLRMDPKDGGNCYPGVRLIAQEANLNKDTVTTHLAKAEDEGWVNRERRGPEAGQAWRGTLYQPRIPEGVRTDRSASDGGVRSDRTKVSKEVGPTSTNTSSDTDGRPFPSVSDLPKNSSGEHNYPPAFERCWAEYPQRKGPNSKVAAYRAWRRSIQGGANPEDLLAGTERYARFCSSEDRTGSEYVMAAKNFFGEDERWAEPWSASGSDCSGPEYKRLR